jgi:hypothetical protein
VAKRILHQAISDKFQSYSTGYPLFYHLFRAPCSSLKVKSIKPASTLAGCGNMFEVALDGLGRDDHGAMFR